MLHLLYVLLATARSSLKPQRELTLENLALRQQLAVVQRKTKRPKLTKVDRAFCVALCRLWPDWQNALLIVKPQTVIGWHRKGLRPKRMPLPVGKHKQRRVIASQACSLFPRWNPPNCARRSLSFHLLQVRKLPALGEDGTHDDNVCTPHLFTSGYFSVGMSFAAG
jgi:hypothetical protein